MKVTFKWGIQGMSGYGEDAVFYYNPVLRRTLKRNYVYPKNVPSAARNSVIMQNLRLIQPSTAYKFNFVDYRAAVNSLPEYKEKPFTSWSCIYLKLLYALQKADNRVDLTTLSRAQIYAQDLPCKTLKAAIEAGLLPAVENYQRFDQEI
jgi:hypothetical protein